MNVDISNKIRDLMKDLVRMRDDSVLPQNLSVYLAKTSTDDKKLSKPQTESERFRREANAGDGSHQFGLPKRTASQQPSDSTSLQNDSRPLNLKEIAATVKAQSSNLKLTTEERETLISMIFATEVEFRSKVNAQAKDLFSSPKSHDIRRPKKQSNHGLIDKDNLTASLLEKRAEIESIRAAQERFIFAPTTPEMQRETSGQVSIPSADFTLQARQAAEKTKPNVQTDRSRPNAIKSGRQSKYVTRRSLTPIFEASEVTVLEEDTGKDRGRPNIHQGPDTTLETIKAKENLRQQQMESGLPNVLIQDTDADSLLEHSNESDSLDGLVIKDFAIHVVDSEPDAAISCLPATEQAIIESNKLRDAIESVKERFQIKVARDKFAERVKQNVELPKTQIFTASIPSTPGTIERSKRISKETDENNNLTATRTTPATVNIIDSANWGDVALHKPIFDPAADGADELGSSSEEDFLNEKDMQFDDLFGVDNVSEPLTSRNTVQKNYNTPKAEKLVDSIENIEDLDNPQFSDLTLDESAEATPKRNANISENIENFEVPQFPAETSSDELAKNFTVAKSEVEKTFEQPRNETDSLHETQHDKDVKKLKELFDTGALSSSITNQRFEEGVLDLLLRQSDSLWDPVVGGIPISFFIPSQNHEMGLLDTSITETNLERPLIKKPEKKLPAYMEALENEWTVNVENNAKSKDIVVEVNDNVFDDVSVLIHGLPQFSYEPPPQYLYRRKVHNIMDSEDESDDSVDIMADHEMNFDDLTNNVAEPTYDFKKAQILDDLAIKMKILRRLKEINEPATKPTADRNLYLSKPAESGFSLLDVFKQNKRQLNALFGIAENEATVDNYVASNDIEPLCKKMPLIDSRFMRDVGNCRYHLELMKAIYKQIIKYVSQGEQPGSSQADVSFDEILNTFNNIKDGRICARIQSCPAHNSPKILQESDMKGKNGESPQKRINQATQTPEVSDSQNQTEHEQPIQNPVKIRKSVSFADSVQENEPPASESAANSKRSNTLPKKRPVDDGNKWTTLDITEVKDLIQHARLAQARHKRLANPRVSTHKTKYSSLR